MCYTRERASRGKTDAQFLLAVRSGHVEAVSSAPRSRRPNSFELLFITVTDSELAGPARDQPILRQHSNGCRSKRISTDR